MFGVYGLKPSSRTVSLFKSTGATGVLLLARNIETPAQTKAYVCGDPFDPETRVGTVINEASAIHLENVVREAVRDGRWPTLRRMLVTC